ncbi:hypothetical protein ABR737_00160 [Streptomyces sp. Edi2]|uniref:hypothetical protein n=1 Tax=Streptomyces sp. Edi2 TaxID=3162528 RepID=UPI00330659EE
MSTTIRIRTTEDAVAVIAAMATKTIAAGAHPGHGLEAVGTRLTTDDVLGRIRAAYNRHTAGGATPKESVIAVGQTLIAAYCNSAGIPTER